ILSPCRISARSKNASVSGGASSGSVHVVAPDFFFFGMTVPHRDDVAGLATLRPDHDHHPFVENARCDESRLAIIEPLIDGGGGSSVEHFIGSCEVQAAIPQGEIALRRIEVISMNYCTP